MALTAVTRRFSFRSVHSLHVGAHREKLHGHEYLLEVSYQDSSTDASGPVKEHVLNALHGRELSGFGVQATGEVLVEWIHAQLAEKIPSLLGVALQETRKNRFVSSRTKEFLL